jgi:hypothetical protein
VKKDIYVVVALNGGSRSYLAGHSIDGVRFCGKWTKSVCKVEEFVKGDAVALATMLNNDWNGKGHRALQKCRCRA